MCDAEDEDSELDEFDEEEEDEMETDEGIDALPGGVAIPPSTSPQTQVRQTTTVPPEAVPIQEPNLDAGGARVWYVGRIRCLGRGR